MAETKSTKEVGVQIVASTGSIWTTPDITADKIVKLMTNPYGKRLCKMQEHLIFNDTPTLEVFGPDGKPDVELTDRLTNMAEQPDVMLWDKMAMAFRDLFWWGCSVYNPVWGVDPENRDVSLNKLRRLPAETFDMPAMSAIEIYSSILQGITLENGEVQYYQRQKAMDVTPVKLDAKGIYLVKDPTEPDLAGQPMIVPIFGVLSMLEFAWNAQMQKVNRVGAPVMFIRVINGTEDDIAYAQTILKNWGKNTSFQLRENMELIRLDVTDSEVALATIKELSSLLTEYFSPTGMMGAQEGTTLGGSSWGEQQLIASYVGGIQRMLEGQFNAMLNKYFEFNAFPDGYTVEIHLPTISVDRSTVEVQQAEAGYRTQTLLINEIRKLLGMPELDEEGLAQLMEEYGSKKPAPNPFAPPEQGEQGEAPSNQEVSDAEDEQEEERGEASAQKNLDLAKESVAQPLRKEAERELTDDLSEFAAKVFAALRTVE